MPQPFSELPKSVTDRGRALNMAGGRVPALIVHPHWDANAQSAMRPAPLLIWMHGRTVSKELDPGRYLVLARAGIATCALDLPGHGERMEADLQQPERTLDVVAQMVGEIDEVVNELRALGLLGSAPHEARLAIGGMSAGGMAALARLTTEHPFSAALIESTTGSWEWQRHRAMHRPEIVAKLNPITHLSTWRNIPVLGLHSTKDAWVAVEGQREFFKALRERSPTPDDVILHEFPETGAPFEHVGFGRMGRAAKELGAAFLARHLLPQRGE